MSSADAEISLADAIGGIAEDLDLLDWEALASCTIEWITIGQYSLNHILVQIQNRLRQPQVLLTKTLALTSGVEYATQIRATMAP